jgi:hypothetical protein
MKIKASLLILQKRSRSSENICFTGTAKPQISRQSGCCPEKIIWVNITRFYPYYKCG